MYDITPPEHIWKIRLIRRPCMERHSNIYDFKCYNSWVKQFMICTLKEPYHVRRTKTDKNGRIYLDPKSKPKCVIKLLNKYFVYNEDIPYASSEIKYMKKIVSGS